MLVHCFPTSHHLQGLLPKHLLDHHQAYQVQQVLLVWRIHRWGQIYQWQQLDHSNQLMHWYCGVYDRCQWVWHCQKVLEENHILNIIPWIQSQLINVSWLNQNYTMIKIWNGIVLMHQLQYYYRKGGGFQVWCRLLKLKIVGSFSFLSLFNKIFFLKNSKISIGIKIWYSDVIMFI